MGVLGYNGVVIFAIANHNTNEAINGVERKL